MAKKTKSEGSSKHRALELALENALHGALLGLRSVTIESPETKLFRVSSFPYCPILHALNPLDRVEDYSSRFYTDIGTTMHELIQDFMPRTMHGSKVFGNWVCRKCGAEQKLTVLPFKPCKCFKNSKKPSGDAWKYAEIEIEYRGLTGHVDKLLQVQTASGEIGYLVMDYKTTNIPAYEVPKKRKKHSGSWTSANAPPPINPALAKKYPVPYNIDQISVYCALLRKVLKLNIVGWALIYVDRSKPITSKEMYHPVVHVWSKKDQKTWMARVDAACEAAPTADKLFNLRKTKGTIGLRPTWAKLIASRPCQTVTDHDNVMRSAFHYDGGCCENMHWCTKLSEKSLVTKFMGMADELRIGDTDKAKRKSMNRGE